MKLPPEVLKFREQCERLTEERRRELQQQMKNTTEGQRLQMMDPDQIARRAIEITAKGIKEYNDAKAGRDTSWDEAVRKATDIAHTSIRMREH